MITIEEYVLSIKITYTILSIKAIYKRTVYIGEKSIILLLVNKYGISLVFILQIYEQTYLCSTGRQETFCRLVLKTDSQCYFYMRFRNILLLVTLGI